MEAATKSCRSNVSESYRARTDPLDQVRTRSGTCRATHTDPCVAMSPRSRDMAARQNSWTMVGWNRRAVDIVI